MAKKKPIISPLGQWAYPGEVTIIPSSKITMKGVNYPVLGIDDLGNSKVMMPGAEYDFPGNYVTEYPQMGKGGLSQWFDEKWVDVKTGKTCGRSGKDKDGRPYPACRPSRRVNETTPKTTSEMSSAEKTRFKREKTSGKRIDYNHKRRELGGENWLDQYQVGGPETSTEQNPERMQGVDIKRKRKNVSDSPKYQYDNKGNLLYTPELNIYPYLSDNSSKDSFWVNPKIPIQNLNPTVEELRTVAAPYYPIDNKLVSDPKLTFKYSEAKPSNYQESLEQEYVLPEVVGKSFGNLPLVKDDGYSPNRRWITSLRNGDKLPTGYRYDSGLNLYGSNKYAYVLKTDPNNLVNYATKDKIENDLSLNDKALYDYLAKINYSPDNVYGLTREVPDQIWNRAEQMRVEMRNNPEIMSWANLHNVDLGYKERYEDNSEDNDDFAPKIPESIYASRLAEAGLPTNRPDYDYGDYETYIAQDPSKFRLVDYFPVTPFLKDARNNKETDDQVLKKKMAKRMGIDPSAFDSGEYLIHYNQSPITEYTPGKKYGGWLDEFQTGGIRRPIYTSNPRDPRIGSYRDSLNLYNSGEDYYSRLKKSSFDSPNIGVSEEDLKKARDENYKKYPWDKLKMPVSNEKSGKKFQPVSKYNIYVYDVGNIESNRYKKPVQPYIYKKPEVSPIYTSDINDPRLASYNDSLYLYKSAKNDFNKFNKLSNNFDRDLNDEEWQRNSDRYDKLLNLQKNKWHTAEYFNGTYRPNYTANYPYKGPKSGLTIQPVGLEGFYREGYHFPRFKKPVQPYIYKKPEVVPEVVDTPITPIEQPVKKIGYSKPVIQQFNYMSNENKAKALQKYGSVGDIPFQGVDINQLKNGGWLEEYQRGGWAGWTPNVGKPYMRTSPAGNAGYTDNTRVVNQNTNVSAANRKAAEAAEYAKRVGSVSQGKTKSAYEKAREASSFVSQAERRKGSADPLDYVLDVFNPAAIGFAGVDLSNNLGSAASNTVQGNFAEAGSDLLGAGLNALSVIPAAAEFKGIVKPLSKFARLTPGQYKVAQQFANNPEKAISQAVSYASKLAQSQIIKNPKLALSLQRGRPVSLDNVNTISGISYGDVSSVANFNKIKPNSISEHAFFRQLEKGVESLDNSVSKRVADLESEEGFRRLVEQEKAYLFDNTDTDLSVIDRVAKLNAKARIEELKNVKNVNKEATEYANTNFLGTGLTNPFVDDSYLYNNAYHRPASLYDQFVKSSGTLNLKKPTPNYSQSVPGEIGMGYNFVGDVPTEMHEIGHVLQRGRTLSLDNGLKNIVPKKELNPINQRNYKYFKKGSSGSEPTAFANELREAMFQKGFIPDYYSPINQQQIQDAYKYFKKNPMGVYNKNTGNFSSNTRIFDFMEPNKANSKLLTEVLNRLPAVAPLAVGAAAASQLPEQKKGGQTSWLNKYK